MRHAGVIPQPRFLGEAGQPPPRHDSLPRQHREVEGPGLEPVQQRHAATREDAHCNIVAANLWDVAGIYIKIYNIDLYTFSLFMYPYKRNLLAELFKMTTPLGGLFYLSLGQPIRFQTIIKSKLIRISLRSERDPSRIVDIYSETHET